MAQHSQSVNQQTSEPSWDYTWEITLKLHLTEKKMGQYYRIPGSKRNKETSL